VSTGLWEHRDGRGEAPLSLAEIDYSNGSMQFDHRPQRDADPVLADYLTEARSILDDALPFDGDLTPEQFTGDFEHLRWFTLPHEVVGD
jgi:hypothetical protein